MMTEGERRTGDPVEREYTTLLDKAVAEKLRGVKVKDADGKEIAAKAPTNDTDVLCFSDDDTWTRQELREMIEGDPPEGDDADQYETRGEQLKAQAIAIVESKKLKSAAPKVAPTEAVTSSAAIGLVKRKAA